MSQELSDRCVLLVLDNFEQVLLSATDVVRLLEACPALKVLTTSRAGLRVSGERQFEVPPLLHPDPHHLPELKTLTQYEAVQLFIQRAGAVKADFTLTGANAPAVAEICARLDGLPLAIELAAARSNLLTPQGLVAMLGRSPALLTGGSRDRPARQQTLRQTIDWSYSLLSDDERQVFHRLAIFVGGCTLEAVESVCVEPGGDTLDHIGSLVEKSLVSSIASLAGEPRVRLLETIREYAFERLRASGDGRPRMVYRTW